ncbi:MAG: hypothetical protein JO317_03360 [Verrucomicrobiae bacterium]|nr:hypothetical protein [Verrucomicrobiae bacterium]
MNFLKLYYDRLLALVALLTVVAGLFLLAFRVKDVKLNEIGPNAPPVVPKVKPFDFEPMEPVKQALQAPMMWSTNMTTHRMFQPRPMILDPQTLHPAFTAGAIDNLPIDRFTEWLKRYDLDPKDPNIRTQDPDNDGYSNEEEFNSDSSPIDPKSTPSPAGKLRIKKVNTKPFPYTYVGYSEATPGHPRIQLNYFDGTLLLSEGEEFGGGYRLKKFNLVKEKKYSPELKRDIEMEITSVTVLDRRGQEVLLERNKPGVTREYYALLYDLKSGKEFEVREGDKFTLESTDFTVDQVLPPDPNKSKFDEGAGHVVISSISGQETTNYELKSYDAREDTKGGAAATNDPNRRAR